VAWEIEVEIYAAVPAVRLPPVLGAGRGRPAVQWAPLLSSARPYQRASALRVELGAPTAEGEEELSTAYSDQAAYPSGTGLAPSVLEYLDRFDGAVLSGAADSLPEAGRELPPREWPAPTGVRCTCGSLAFSSVPIGATCFVRYPVQEALELEESRGSVGSLTVPPDPASDTVEDTDVGSVGGDEVWAPAGDHCPAAGAADAVRDVESEYIGERLAELEQWAVPTTRPFVRRLARIRKEGSREQGEHVKVILQGQRIFVLKPAADYQAELEHLVSQTDLEVIESLSLEGEAEIIAEIEQEGEEEDMLLQLMEFESNAVVLLDALGVLGGAGCGAEACEETESAKQLVRTMEPRRLSWFRRRIAAMWLARKAGWFFPPRSGAQECS